jgi:hypothetical protein
MNYKQTLFLRTNSKFSLPLRVLIQKLQITILYAQMQILLKFAQIATEILYILNSLLQQLAFGTVFTWKTYILR